MAIIVNTTTLYGGFHLVGRGSTVPWREVRLQAYLGFVLLNCNQAREKCCNLIGRHYSGAEQIPDRLATRPPVRGRSSHAKLGLTLGSFVAWNAALAGCLSLKSAHGEKQTLKNKTEKLVLSIHPYRWHKWRWPIQNRWGPQRELLFSPLKRSCNKHDSNEFFTHPYRKRYQQLLEQHPDLSMIGELDHRHCQKQKPQS